MRRNKVLSLISLAKKAGKIAAGEYQTEQAVKTGKAFLVILSEDASENTAGKFRNMCAFYEVPYCIYGKMEELGAAIGCGLRSSLAVLDHGLAASVKKQLDSGKNGGCEQNENQGP